MVEHRKHRLLAWSALLASVVALPMTAAAGEFRLLPDSAIVPAAAPSLSGSLAAPPAASTAASSLVSFEQPLPSYELTGEDDVTLLSFHLNAAQLAGDGFIQIAYQNAVSVLPDTGLVDVSINGKAAGSFAIRSPNGFRTEKLPVAASLLREGRNEVRLHARQHHRVDCSLDATYELWTRLDPVQSGFVAASPVTFASLDDLIAIGKTDAGLTEIRLIAPDKTAAAIANDSAAVIQALSLLLDRRDIVVKVASEAGTGPGIDLYVGTDGQASQTPEAQRLLSTAAPGLTVRNGSTPGRATVLMRATGGNISTQLLKAVRGPMRAGLASGVFANSWGTLVADAASAYTLRDTGYVTAPFAGRLSRTHFDLQMPADFYPAEYDTMDFYLNAATAPGLALGAQLLMRINDRVVTSFPFRNTNGEQFDNKRIELPLRAFRPGTNRVELLAEVPATTDAACQPEARNDDRPRFMLLDTSRIVVPQLARIGRLPDLGALSGAAYPFRDGKAFDVFVDRSDPQSIGAALTMVARLGLAARKPLSAEIKFSAPVDGGARNALIISTAPTLAALPAAEAPQAAITGLLDGFGQANAAAPDPVTTASLDQAPAATPAGGDAQALLQAFQASTAVEGDNLSVLSRVQSWSGTVVTRFQRWLNYQDANAPSYPRNEAGALLTLSQMRSPSGLGTWTIVKSDSPDNLAMGMDRLAEPAVWSRLEGGLVSVRAEKLELVSQPATSRFITEITDPSLGNWRRLAASWFSDNFQIYVVLVIVLLGGFGAWLGLIVSKKGVRTDQ